MTGVTPVVPAGRAVIQSYGGGRFRIGGTVHEGSVVVLPDVVVAWAVERFDELTAESFAPVLERAGTLDLLLLGCGARMALLPPALRQRLRDDGIVTETMGTGAACRTYNVLLAEERRVAAALIAV